LSHSNSFRPRVAVIGVVVGLAAMVAVPAAQAAKPKKDEVTVMSRNVYLGADLTPALEADNANELAFAAQGIWNDVETTDFPNRAKLLAKEIKQAKPDLVGLQEVALWRGDDIAPAQDGPTTPATTVKYDFLELLMKQLKKQDANYKVVRQQKEADIEAPLSGGSTNPVPGGDPGDGRLTMRDVILANKDKKADVKTKFDFSQRFRKDHSLVIENLAGTPLDVTVWRGFVGLDANVRGNEFRFVDTHLEAFDNDAKLAQAEELTADIVDVAVNGTQDEIGPAHPSAVETPVVLVGDLNSDNEIVEDEGDTPQHQADELPYAAIVDAGLEERSFDGPEEDAIDDLVYGCCFGDDLIAEPPPAALDDIDHNIDKVMVSDDDHGLGVDPNTNDVTLVDSFRTGDKPSEYSRFNRWASDHLGVVSTLKFPTP
jgi:endonuclease/exonuclease/phosphatase family metal-dependent hydrolase